MFGSSKGVSLSPPQPLRVIQQCASCRGQVELDCEGISGYAGYQTFNEFVCPHCQKLNRVMTFGAITAVRPTHSLEADS